MQVACGNCGTIHVLKETDVSVHPRVQFRCSKCGQATIVDTAKRPDATVVISPLPSFARKSGVAPNPQLLAEDDGLKLPPGCSVVLTILSGPAKGSAHTLERPRVILGRKGADIAMEDKEISRHHCLLEVREDVIHLKDLDSTNGTFFEGERVRAAMLRDGTEFRIGESIVHVDFHPSRS
jgi:pSer/pThr/pTyr-binding forkhead associated (FHA) protein